MIDELSEQRAKLKDWIRSFYGAYFSELRSQLQRPDVSSEAVPDWMGGYKRVLAAPGRDGVVVFHIPLEQQVLMDPAVGLGHRVFLPAEPDAHEDRYTFGSIPEAPAIVIARFMGGGEEIDITLNTPWGVKVFNTPLQSVDSNTGEVYWLAPWTRLVAVDFNNLRYFEDPERARAEARADVEPYIRQEDSL